MPSSPTLADLRSALLGARRRRDEVATTALRTTVAAIANAEAVPIIDVPTATSSRHVAGAVSGLGATEMPRRELSEADVRAIVLAELNERETAAARYRGLGRPEHADRLLAEAEALRPFADWPPPARGGVGDKVTTILSIQSSVAYGHVGNSAATFPLMRLGLEVWPVLTVHFSNHTGYGRWRGPLLEAGDVAEVILGIDERDVLHRVDAVLSGYQGAEEVGAEVLRAVALVKQRNPQAIYCCDPVMGDTDRGLFVRPGIPEFMRDQVVPSADIVTPNQFELDYLTGRTTRTLAEVLAAADELRAAGPDLVLVTSAVLDGDDPDTLTMLAVSGGGAWRVVTPRLQRTFTGSGDLTSALFLAHHLRTSDPASAISSTADAVYSVLKATTDADSLELLLVQAQDELVSPTHHFEVEQVR